MNLLNNILPPPCAGSLRLSERVNRLFLGAVLTTALAFLFVVPTQQAAPTQNPWLDIGDCTVDYTSWLPDWIENWVDDLISGSWSNYLEPEHPDVYFKEFANASEQDQLGSTIYRGFYAQGNTKQQWQEKLKAWFFERERIIYINGVVMDKEHRNNCDVWERDLEFNGPFRTRAGWAKLRFNSAQSYGSNYHLFARNCQHFRNFVLTGKFTSTDGSG